MAVPRLLKLDLLALLVLVSYFHLISCGPREGQVQYRTCLSGTQECSHGKCIERIIRTRSGLRRERECVCDAQYYGKDCTLYVDIDFKTPVLIQSRGRSLEEDSLRERDALAFSIAFGGHK